MFQRLCKGALQVSKAAVYADDNRTPIFNLSFECVLIFKNRVEQSRTDNLTSIDEIELKITNLHEGIRSSKTHLRHFRDLLHKVYCLHVYKGKNKIASMVYLEVAKVNFFEVTDVSADQVAWLSLDFQILQYNLAKYRDPTKADAEFERRCSGFKLNAVLENALEDPAKIFLFAYLGKSTDYARSNYEVYRFLKGTEAGSYKLPSLSKLITSEVIKKGRQSIVQREGKKPVEPNYQHHTDDEMAVNPSSNNHLKKEVKNVKADHKKALEETVNQTKAKLTIQNPKKVRTKQLKSEVSEEDQHLQEAQSGSDNEEVLAMQANFSERSSYYEEAEKAQQVFSRQSRNAVVGGALSAQNGESTLHRSRPGINDDLTTSKLKHLLLKDMKKTAIVSEKEPTDESEDSYVEAIFSQVPGTVSKPKPESSKQKITVSAATIRRDSRAKSAARSRVTGREAAIEDLQADEDERFDLPKGKLVAMLSRMEMQNMQQTQECQSNQAELNSLREEHAQMVQKSKELKSANRVFKTERDSVALQIEKLSLENEDLKSKVAELTSIKSELESASKLLRISLDDTNTKLK